MSKNLKVGLIMVIVFSPIILFVLPMGLFVLLMLPVIVLVGVLSIMVTEGLTRLPGGKKIESKDKEEKLMQRKLTWFWVNMVMALLAMGLEFDWVVWASLLTLPYLSRKVYEGWGALRRKEISFREFWTAYKNAFNHNTTYFAVGMFVKLYLGAGFMVRELRNSLIQEYVPDPRGWVIILIGFFIGLALMRSFYKDVKEFSVEVIPGDEELTEVGEEVF